MKSLVTRTITGVFFVAALVGCMFWSELSFTLFFALVAGMGVWEFSANVNRHAGASVNAFITTAAAVALVFAVSQCSSRTPNYASFLPFVSREVSSFARYRRRSTLQARPCAPP